MQYRWQDIGHPQCPVVPQPVILYLPSCPSTSPWYWFYRVCLVVRGKALLYIPYAYPYVLNFLIHLHLLLLVINFGWLPKDLLVKTSQIILKTIFHKSFRFPVSFHCVWFYLGYMGYYYRVVLVCWQRHWQVFPGAELESMWCWRVQPAEPCLT